MGQPRSGAIVGVSDHGGWAVLVTVAGDGTLLDRRRVELVDEGLPKLPSRILGVAIRECPRLPPTTAERIRNYWAQNRADSVMCREALAGAAESRGWSVHWYDAKRVLDAACDALHVEDLDAHFLQVRRSIGPPWGKDHKVAMAAAIVAAKARQR